MAFFWTGRAGSVKMRALRIIQSSLVGITKQDSLLRNLNYQVLQIVWSGKNMSRFLEGWPSG